MCIFIKLKKKKNERLWSSDDSDQLIYGSWAGSGYHSQASVVYSYIAHLNKPWHVLQCELVNCSDQSRDQYYTKEPKIKKGWRKHWILCDWMEEDLNKLSRKKYTPVLSENGDRNSVFSAGKSWMDNWNERYHTDRENGFSDIFVNRHKWCLSVIVR